MIISNQRYLIIIKDRYSRYNTKPYFRAMDDGAEQALSRRAIIFDHRYTCSSNDRLLKLCN